MTSEQIKIFTPRQALNKAYLKEKILRSEIALFKNNLDKLFASIDHDEREENVKTILRDFLIGTYYKNNHCINTLRDVDLVIYLENNQNKAAVLAEVKRPKNKTEMMTRENVNAKAMHELILYYLEERIDHKNNEIKYLVATNIYEWFIFDAVLFEHLFYNNKQLVKDYEHWRDKQKTSGNTDFFYTEIAKPFLDALGSEIMFVYFNLQDYKTSLPPGENEDEKKLIALYKILSPVHLLKQSFANDSNSLDRNFYTELLHIIGLVETKEKNKKIIVRKPENERNPGSFIENTILILETENTLARINHPQKFGETVEEQIYGLALELSLTWINRILFLKLLEAQLYNYHKNDKHKFLNKVFINDFDELYKLFHQVLAVPYKKRSELINNKFGHIPYLNSSLFEISELESESIKINSLDDNTPITLYQNTVLKDRTGKKRSEQMPAMYYLFEFLDAYDFTSEGNEEIREDKKTLINASVLGLIFEKINGYKDGSFFTPGFITMYMCRETLQRAVVQKFNAAYRWKCKTLADVKNHLAQRRNTKDILEFNALINSLKIVDPAVGSGHFLVSALNELIAIKSELGLLADKKGSLLVGYEAHVENDELIITYNSGEDIFEYHAPKTPPFGEKGIHDPHRFSAVGEAQRVQETLFNEKQTIIENCLFGVDINPNSVKIARLRLWIELLKNAFYTEESGYYKLETLPNIDINIKEGNSLISRFPLNADLKSALKTIRYTIEDYKNFVRNYKNTNDKNEKNNFRRFIEDIKNNFRAEISANDPRKKKLSNMVFELHNKYQTERLIDVELSKKDKEKLKHEEKKLEEAIKKLREELDSEAANTIYNNAFEWRFEFPEALDDEGNFVGFDVVIGNPPYGVKFQNENKDYFKKHYTDVHTRMLESFNYFTSKFIGISNNSGRCCLIVPSSFLNQIEFARTRQLILENYSLFTLVNLGDGVFVDVATPTCIVGFTKNKTIIKTKYADLKSVDRTFLDSELRKVTFEIENYQLKNNPSFSFIYRPYQSVLAKCYNGNPTLKDVAEEVATGISSGLDKAYVFTKKEIAEKSLEVALLKKLIVGGEIHQYYLNSISEKSIIYITDENDVSTYPQIQKELLNNKSQLELRREAANGTIKWYSLNWPRRKKLFEQPKILVRQTANRIIAAYDDKKWFCLKSGIIIQLPQDTQLNYLYLLGLLNSSLMNFIYTDLVHEEERIFPEVKPIQLFKLPIKVADEKAQIIVEKLVAKIVSIKKKNPQADTSELEAEIDKLVYQLYGLTEEEIKIVEGK